MSSKSCKLSQESSYHSLDINNITDKTYILHSSLQDPTADLRIPLDDTAWSEGDCLVLMAPIASIAGVVGVSASAIASWFRFLPPVRTV